MAAKNVVRILKNQTKFKSNSLPSSFTECSRSYASWGPPDTKTHTNQAYAPDDYRNIRFLGKHKEVNPNWAIKLINEVAPEECNERIVSCDGGGGPLGHPIVYINLDKPGNHTCGYCGLRFYKNDHHH